MPRAQNVNNVVISLTDEEAEELQAVLSFIPYGASTLADKLCGNLTDLGVNESSAVLSRLERALKVKG